tara:strand:+ start:126 stop:356 length:231 start_codon:yes stop_codon:yes gene_type:complete
MLENNTENRETLAELIVSYWDIKDLLIFAEAQLMDAWDASVVGEDAAEESWAHDVEMYRDQLAVMTDMLDSMTEDS